MTVLEENVVSHQSSNEHTVASEEENVRDCTKRLMLIVCSVFHFSNKNFKNQFNNNLLSGSMSQTLCLMLEFQRNTSCPTMRSSKHF